ncbi:hypothetical protein HAX54_004422 [Datura stramonium]|uniref:Uncharacterized protein n=1 Tax=Datura stramonium TaxID=4076 RepID=A0ABS8T990_DATST|nr:hypothetical protein [Datura stramonium]
MPEFFQGPGLQILYLKNLAKEVIVDDIYVIFGSLFGSIDEAKSSLAVKLMQKISLANDISKNVVEVILWCIVGHKGGEYNSGREWTMENLVNGYVFKGKPIVIQFGRDLKQQKTSREHFCDKYSELMSGQNASKDHLSYGIPVLSASLDSVSHWQFIELDSQNLQWRVNYELAFCYAESFLQCKAAGA